MPAQSLYGDGSENRIGAGAGKFLQPLYLILADLDIICRPDPFVPPQIPDHLEQLPETNPYPPLFANLAQGFLAGQAIFSRDL